MQNNYVSQITGDHGHTIKGIVLLHLLHHLFAAVIICTGYIEVFITPTGLFSSQAI